MLISRGERGLLSEILCDNSGHHNKFLSSEWNQSLQVQSNPPFFNISPAAKTQNPFFGLSLLQNPTETLATQATNLVFGTSSPTSLYFSCPSVSAFNGVQLYHFEGKPNLNHSGESLVYNVGSRKYLTINE